MGDDSKIYEFHKKKGVGRYISALVKIFDWLTGREEIILPRGIISARS